MAKSKTAPKRLVFLAHLLARKKYLAEYRDERSAETDFEEARDAGARYLEICNLLEVFDKTFF